METQQSSASVPHPYIAKYFPDGVPENGSSEFHAIACKWASYSSRCIEGFVMRKLSMIDRHHLVRITKEVMRDFINGNHEVAIFEEIQERYYGSIAGYTAENAFWLVNGTAEERSQKVRELFTTLHARAHHE